MLSALILLMSKERLKGKETVVALSFCVLIFSVNSQYREVA